MCNTVHDDWQDYYRIPSKDHTIEAKPARGGEEIGDEFRKRIAQKGDWLCRNPENGYSWSMNEHDFYDFYRPLDLKHLPEKEAKPKKNKGKTSASNETKNDAEAGPLFD